MSWSSKLDPRQDHETARNRSVENAEVMWRTRTKCTIEFPSDRKAEQPSFHEIQIHLSDH